MFCAIWTVHGTHGLWATNGERGDRGGWRGQGRGALRRETLGGWRASASAARASTTDVGSGRGWALKISENAVAVAPERAATRTRRAVRTGQLAHRGVDRQHVLFCFITASSGRQPNTKL
jgi:hypothetical protein